MQELKKRLSAVLRAAAGGSRVRVTRHKQPLAVIGPVAPEQVHVGKKVGHGKLRPLFSNKTRGQYLQLLADDRRDSAERD